MNPVWVDAGRQHGVIETRLPQPLEAKTHIVEFLHQDPARLRFLREYPVEVVRFAKDIPVGAYDLEFPILVQSPDP